MNEAEFKNDLIGALTFIGWKCQRHEDKHENYIPDISFAANGVDGWMEVKWSHECPKTLDDIGHWTAGQQKWLEECGRTGGGFCFLIVGTPVGIFVWKHETLDRVRKMSWAATAQWCTVVAIDLGHLTRQLELQVRRPRTRPAQQG